MRKTFLNQLPHPRTIRKWFNTSNFNPGISMQIIKSIKSTIDDNEKNGKILQFGIQADDMSIKKSIEWDGQQYHGLVDIGMDINDFNDDREATYVFVIMLVALNAHFKTPISFYFIRSLNAEERANIITNNLIILNDNGIKNIRSITFDGAASNLSMIQKLGIPNIKEDLNKTSFDHPITKEPIYVIPDACHMIKLIRNMLNIYNIINDEGRIVSWTFLVKLVQLQEKENIHLGTKITNRHINFHNEKMKVKLAAQIFSTRVSDTLIFLNHTKSEFAEALPTARFCQIFNNIFDIMNSRRKFGKNETEQCISIENLSKIEANINNYITYIKSLKLVDKKSDMVIPILESKRRVGFWGLIFGMNSVLNIAKYLFEKKYISYLLTYKMSQDHIETFFSSIRRMGGLNNNPTCLQFKRAYKKLMTHVHAIVPEGANCSVQDETQILKSQIETEKSDEILDNIFTSFDHDYESPNGWCWNEYNSEVVTYIAGYVIKTIKNKIKCDMCRQSLESKENNSLLLKIKNRRGLLLPSPQVITICKVAERVLRQQKDLFTVKNLMTSLIYCAKKLLPGDIFNHLDDLSQKSVIDNHKSQLIYNILHKYFDIRLYHEGRTIKNSTKRIRTLHNRLVIFANQ